MGYPHFLALTMRDTVKRKKRKKIDNTQVGEKAKNDWL